MKIPIAFGLIALSVMFSSATPVFAQEGGIEVFAGATLFQGGTRASVSHIYKRKSTLFMGDNTIANPAGMEFTENRTVLGIDHGFLPNLQGSLLVPFVDREMIVGGASMKGTGPGDIAALLKYRVYKKDWPRSSIKISIVGGVEMPTGETDETSGGVRLPPGIQPGGGAWDPFVAVSGVVSLDKWRYDGLVLYKFNNEGSQSFEPGDFLVIEGSVAYRFIYNKYPGPTASAKFGLQWRHQDRDRMGGMLVAASGSDELIARFGLGFHPIPQMDLNVSLDVPISQDFNGVQLGQDIRVFFAFGMRF